MQNWEGQYVHNKLSIEFIIKWRLQRVPKVPQRVWRLIEAKEGREQNRQVGMGEERSE